MSNSSSKTHKGKGKIHKADKREDKSTGKAVKAVHVTSVVNIYICT